jgi:hypothetical protein
LHFVSSCCLAGLNCQVHLQMPNADAWHIHRWGWKRPDLQRCTLLQAIPSSHCWYGDCAGLRLGVHRGGIRELRNAGARCNSGFQ